MTSATPRTQPANELRAAIRRGDPTHAGERNRHGRCLIFRMRVRRGYCFRALVAALLTRDLLSRLSRRGMWKPSAEYSEILFRSVRTETPRRRADTVLFP